MLKQTYQPARQKARDFVLNLIRSESSKQDVSTLPGIRELAVQCGVSTVTMWKAVHDLVTAGIVTISKRRVVLSTTAVRDPASKAKRVLTQGPNRSVPLWQATVSRISRDILAGIYPRGEQLPPGKELLRRYGISHVTLQKSLRALHQAGELVRSRKSYALPDIAPASSFSTLVMIGKKEPGDSLGDRAPRSRELWQAFDRICRQKNMSLAMCSWEELRTRRVHSTEEAVLGYVVRDLDHPAEFIDREFMALRSAPVPLAVVDELGVAAQHRALTNRPRTAVFNLASSSAAGQELADRLLSYGHRQIAFFSPHEGTEWGCNRLEGIRARFEYAGLAEAVADYHLEFSDDWELREAIVAHPAYRRLAAELDTFSHTVTGGNPKEEDIFFRDPGFAYIQRQFLRARFHPLFEDAFSRSGITAWVGVDDETAVIAQSWLARRGAGHSKAIAGFDNSFDALARGLTSYDFNVEALVNAVIAFVLNPAWRNTKSPQTFDIPGAVVTRNSTSGIPGNPRF